MSLPLFTIPIIHLQAINPEMKAARNPIIKAPALRLTNAFVTPPITTSPPELIIKSPKFEVLLTVNKPPLPITTSLTSVKSLMVIGTIIFTESV